MLTWNTAAGPIAREQWSRSVSLTKTSGGFEASVPVPYDSEVVYKFIVDGDVRIPPTVAGYMQ